MTTKNALFISMFASALVACGSPGSQLFADGTGNNTTVTRIGADAGVGDSSTGQDQLLEVPCVPTTPCPIWDQSVSKGPCGYGEKAFPGETKLALDVTVYVVRDDNGLPSSLQSCPLFPGTIAQGCAVDGIVKVVCGQGASSVQLYVHP